jgi:hypothetical protein
MNTDNPRFLSDPQDSRIQQLLEDKSPEDLGIHLTPEEPRRRAKSQPRAVQAETSVSLPKESFRSERRAYSIPFPEKTVTVEVTIRTQFRAAFLSGRWSQSNRLLSLGGTTGRFASASGGGARERHAQNRV